MQVVYMFESIKNCLDSIIKAIESRQWFASLCMCRRNVLASKSFTLFQPALRYGIARHTPVASGRKTAYANLGTIGQARTFELLVEEPAVKYC